jgi:hypothetical protein
MPYFPHWYTGLELCVIKTVFMWSWCSWETLSGRMVTSTGIFLRPSTLPWGLPSPTKSQIVAFLPYVRLIFNCNSRLLSHHNVKSVGFPPNKISSFLRFAKDDLELKTPGVYTIPCEWGLVYTGQTGCSIDTRLKEHQQHICLEHLGKLAMAEHSIDLGHHIQLHHSTKPRYMDHIIREGT